MKKFIILLSPCSLPRQSTRNPAQSEAGSVMVLNSTTSTLSEAICLISISDCPDSTASRLQPPTTGFSPYPHGRKGYMELVRRSRSRRWYVWIQQCFRICRRCGTYRSGIQLLVPHEPVHRLASSDRPSFPQRRSGIQLIRSVSGRYSIEHPLSLLEEGYIMKEKVAGKFTATFFYSELHGKTSDRGRHSRRKSSGTEIPIEASARKEES